MVGDHVAPLVDESLGGGGLGGLVRPLVGVADQHGHVGVHAPGPQIVGGVPGDDLREGQGRHIAQLAGLGLEPRGDSGQIPGLGDPGAVGAGVVQAVLPAPGPGGGAEPHVGAVPGGLGQGGLKVAGGGEKDLAPVVQQVADRPGAGVAVRQVRPDLHLGIVVDAQSLAGGPEALDVVIVVGIGLAAVKEQADLHLPGGDGCDFGGLPGGFGLLLGLGVGGGAAGGQAQQHGRSQKERQDLFGVFPIVPPWKRAAQGAQSKNVRIRKDRPAVPGGLHV